jgi:muramoyltetrapeptide carboxypeptidase
MNRFASGELVGGNLSILYSLLGSTSAIDCTDKILFIEDLDEYHIDRMMMNLKRNGCLENIKGLL